MNGHSASARVPRLGDLEAEALALVRELDPRRLCFLDKKGEWAENPEGMRDRISHALLYHLRSQSEKDKASFFVQAFSPFLTESRWPIAEKMAASRTPAPKSSSLLVLFEALLWVLEHEAWRVNAEAPAPEWNTEARAFQAESRAKQRSLEESLASLLSIEEWKELLESKAEVTKSAAELLTPLIRLIAEEERHSAALERLVAESSLSKRQEEAYSLILERIQPPLGIVTQIPPALFFPCLRLLLDGRIDPGSGIPHLASLILSVFQDPRSAESLLLALTRYPLGFTKIRENLIYTLGNLKEERAVDALIEVLEAADEIKETATGRPTVCLLLEQKEEAIWALGKIGLGAVKAVPALARYADHPSAKLKTYLAWTLGEVGRAQKGATGGVSADVVIALLKLLKDKNRQIFEETVGALRKIDLPEFVHSLYLYHVGAISILGLKPAQRGLYELSETLHHLLRTKKRTIMAVNGDSGTGKTYFCQAIADGFAGIRPGEILYLMRDSKRGQRVFNRLLGLPWLKKHIDPCYYQDYPVSEDEDDPEANFRRFLEENSDKRLIILDGCRDRHYFQRVIDFFYLQGELDVEVNFRANFSTRRQNLETREFALESVKLHLQFLEEPALEDTSFYQEGMVILYDLDNSLASRLDREETRELFERPRIDSWGELIRIGDFSGETITSPCREEKLRLEEKGLEVWEEAWPDIRALAVTPTERRLKPVLNEDLKAEPNLLKEIPLGDIWPARLRFYAQDQVAGRGEDGELFVLTFLDNRIFQARIEGIADFALLGRTFYLAAPGRGLLSLSFERNEIADWKAGDAFPQRIVGLPPDRVVTSHQDGTLRVWDSLEKRVLVFAGQLSSLTALAVDHAGSIYGGDETGRLRQWDLERRTVRDIPGSDRAVSFLRYYPFGKLLAVEDGRNGGRSSSLRIIDPAGLTARSISLPPGKVVNGINVYHDGRIIAAISEAPGEQRSRGKNLLILSPGDSGCSILPLSGHAMGTKDCLTMGPKIITCGADSDGTPSLRIWGSEFFVRTELSKLFIKP
jgi:HEAT repeat protein